MIRYAHRTVSFPHRNAGRNLTRLQMIYSTYNKNYLDRRRVLYMQLTATNIQFSHFGRRQRQRPRLETQDLVR